jgi:hypothetical protein
MCPTEQSGTLATRIPVGVIDLEDALFSAIATISLFILLPHIEEVEATASYNINRV